MENDTQTLTIELHYHIDKEGCHEMNAQIHNKCEGCIIDTINHFADIFDEDISLDVSALSEGGVIDKLKVTINNSVTKAIFLTLVGAIIEHFISPSTSLDETQRLLNRAEVIKKIKDGNYSYEEIKFVITGDAKLITAKSKYYSELCNEPHVTRVSCSTYGNNCPPDALRSNSIDKKDFVKQVLKNTTRTDTQKYTGTNVLVVAPVLSKVSKAKWRGIFNGEDVSFRIEDREFLQQVYNKEVGFTTGTSLRCDVKVIVKTKYDTCGNILPGQKDMIVSNITSWFDGYTIQHETKHYKRKKIEDRQLNLFNDDEL